MFLSMKNISKPLVARPQAAVLHFDGCSRGNPGQSSYAVVGEIGGLPVRHSKLLGHGTNNQAEWQGLLAALTIADEAGVRVVKIRGDSQLVINQANGDYKVKDASLRVYYEQAIKLMAKFECVDLEWVPREENRRADAEANLAFRKPIRSFVPD